MGIGGVDLAWPVVGVAGSSGVEADIVALTSLTCRYSNTYNILC
jgi:hypothetical protein